MIPEVSIIIVCHHEVDQLVLALDAISRSSFQEFEILIVLNAPHLINEDRISFSNTRVIRCESEIGISAARNLAAKEALGRFLFFTDPDVRIFPDTLERIYNRLMTEGIHAVIGSYDEGITSNIVTCYKNLLNHYHHQHGSEHSLTFWAACGGIRRDVFMEVGGFDETYFKPSIEDIELGYRLCRNKYNIMLDKEILVHHDKYWTLTNLMHSDYFSRALPWSRLLLKEPSRHYELNLRWPFKASVLLVWLIPLGMEINLSLGMFLFVLWLSMNASIVRYFGKPHKFVFFISALALHYFHYMYSSLAFVQASFEHFLKNKSGKSNDRKA